MRLISVLLRWTLPAIGVLAVAVGLLDAPRRGDPPLASILGRADTVVRDAVVEQLGAPGMRPRYAAHVEVAWPPGAEATARLRGLEGEFATGSQARAEALVAAHRPGTRLRVRVADGLPWSDRTDWFALLWTAGAVVLGGLLAAVGFLRNRTARG